MCERNDTVPVELLVPGWLAWEGVDTVKTKDVDRCIAPLVVALNEVGMTTVASCCGHGRLPGRITLVDHRDILIVPEDKTERVYALFPPLNDGGPKGADQVTPDDIIEQRKKGWVDFDPEDYCHRCGRPNISWFVDSPLWNSADIEGEIPSGIICPQCFVEKVGLAEMITWELKPDPLTLHNIPPVVAERLRKYGYELPPSCTELRKPTHE